MPQGRLRVLIVGGGSGGHVIPALAVARALVEQHAAEVRFVGTARGMETRLVPAAGFPLHLVQVGQLNQVGWRKQAATVLKLPVGVLQCVRIMRAFRPDVVFSVGGYASGPGMAAAILTGTPRVAYEPNAIPGLANRWIGRWVQAAAINFAETAQYFRNAQITGVPVRAEFFNLPARQPDAAARLLIFGGSQGARALNRIVPQIATTLLEAVPGLTILHQCGASHQAETERAYENDPELREHRAGSWRVAAFLEDMPLEFAAASLVLCRSGATTVAELAAAAKPSLLIPFPRAADDHQKKNAEAFARAGAAVMLLESELTAESLLSELTALCKDPRRLAQMSSRARGLAHPDAAGRIAAMIKQQQPG